MSPPVIFVLALSAPGATLPLTLDVITGPVRDGLNGERGIMPRVSYKAGSVYDKEIVDIVRLTITIQYRGLGIIAHTTRADLMISNAPLPSFCAPDLYGACGRKNFSLTRSNELRVFVIERMEFVGDPYHRYAPSITDAGVDLDTIRLHWHILHIRIQVQIATKIFSLKFFVCLSPSGRSRRTVSAEPNGMVDIKIVDMGAAESTDEIIYGNARARAVIMRELSFENPKRIGPDMGHDVPADLPAGICQPCRKESVA